MKKCILIYDDDPEILLVSKIILEQQDYQVETRICCDNIIKDIAKVNPCVILMDLRIPKIGGEKATKLMKNKSATKNIPVIIFSANTEIKQACERVKANGFLKKPFEVADMLSVIESHIA